MISLDPAGFKAYFARGQFTYGDTLPAVLDSDIQNAIGEALAVFNPGLYPDDATGVLALEYLSAHFLQGMLDLADSQGLTALLQSARGAVGISESLAVPEWMTQGEFAFYSTTAYGQRFLVISKPYLDGAVFSVQGGTKA